MSTWSARRARALALESESPHAAEILRCYADVLGVQERTAAQVPVREWLATVQSSDVGATALSLGRLPLGEVVPRFAGFLVAMEAIGTEVMRAEASRMAASGDAEQRLALEAALAVGSDDEVAPFHARAFIEAVATTLAGRVLPAVASEDPAATTCHVCGAPPLVATLRDASGALGAGGLVCSRCGTERRVRRLACVFCGESDSTRLRIHSAESVPHVRIDECESCRRYIKTVDLRRRGDAVPIVEDLATPELDLWARDQGLSKGRANLFGM